MVLALVTSSSVPLISLLCHLLTHPSGHKENNGGHIRVCTGLRSHRLWRRGGFLANRGFFGWKIFGFISPGDAEKVFELFKLQAERTLGNPNVEEGWRYPFLNRWSGCNLTEFKGWDKIPHISSLLTYACLLCKLMLEQLWGFWNSVTYGRRQLRWKLMKRQQRGPSKGDMDPFLGQKGDGFPDFHHKVLVWGTEFMVYQFGEWFMLTICLYTFIIS